MLGAISDQIYLTKSFTADTGPVAITIVQLWVGILDRIQTHYIHVLKSSDSWVGMVMPVMMVVVVRMRSVCVEMFTIQHSLAGINLWKEHISMLKQPLL